MAASAVSAELQILPGAVEKGQDALEEKELKAAPSRITVFKNKPTDRKESTPMKEAPELATASMAAPVRASTSNVLEPKIIVAGGPPEDPSPSSSDASHSSSGDDERRRKRRHKCSWRDERGKGAWSSFP